MRSPSCLRSVAHAVGDSGRIHTNYTSSIRGIVCLLILCSRLYIRRTTEKVEMVYLVGFFTSVVFTVVCWLSLCVGCEVYEHNTINAYFASVAFSRTK
jgi:hypothetical protein